MSQMDKSAERKLVSSVEQTIRNVNSGMAPTEALAKVAADEKHTPDEIRRIQDAYNQSRTLHHLAISTGVEKHATFDLADAEEAITQVYPESFKFEGHKKAASLAAEYLQPSGVNYIEQINLTARLKALRVEKPKLEKAASKVKPRFQVQNEKRAYRIIEEQARGTAVKLQGDLMTLGEQVRTHFHDTPFHEIEIGLKQQFGKAASGIAELTWSLTDGAAYGQRRASAAELASSNVTLVDLRGPGYQVVENLVKSALLFQTQINKYKEAAAIHLRNIPTPMAKSASHNINHFLQYEDDSRPFDKPSSANTAKSMTGSAISAVSGGLQNMGDSNDYGRELVEQLSRIDDPTVRDQMQQIRVRSMLNDFMANDDIISSYDDQEVLDFYDDIAQTAPNIADRSTIVRGLLRRALTQGHVDPFEAGQIASTGVNLAKLDQSIGEQAFTAKDTLDKPEFNTIAGLSENKSDEPKGLFSALGRTIDLGSRF